MAVSSSTPARLTVREVGTTIQVLARGRLHADSAGALAQHLVDALREGPEIVVLDLEDVSVVDPACLSVLTRTQTEAWSRGIGLVVIRPAIADVRTLAAFDVALGRGLRA